MKLSEEQRLFMIEEIVQEVTRVCRGCFDNWKQRRGVRGTRGNRRGVMLVALSTWWQNGHYRGEEETNEVQGNDVPRSE